MGPRSATSWLLATVCMLAAGAGAGAGADGAWHELPGSVLVIAHRGNSASHPEHTIAAYAAALLAGADYVECDAVSTADGVLICRHDRALDATTDIRARLVARTAPLVAAELAAGGRPAGAAILAADVSWAAIQSLGAIQRVASRDHSSDGHHPPASLRQLLQLVAAHNGRGVRPVGVYVETKDAQWHTDRGLALEPRLAELLAEFATTVPRAFVQSFEPASLAALATAGVTAPRVLLLNETILPEDLTARWLEEAAASGIAAIGPAKATLAPLIHEATCIPAVPTGCKVTECRYCAGRLAPGAGARGAAAVSRAHAAGLKVHAWTFRNEGGTAAIDFRADPAAEIAFFVDAIGIDGIFADDPAAARAALARRPLPPSPLPSLVVVVAAVSIAVAALLAAAYMRAGVARPSLRPVQATAPQPVLTFADRMAGDHADLPSPVTRRTAKAVKA